MTNEEEVPRALTLTNLLLLIGLVIAFQSAFMEVHYKHKTWGSIVIGIVIGAFWAALSSYVEWQLLSRLVKWIRKTALLNVCGLGLLLIWPILAGAAGVGIGSFANKFFLK